MEYIPYDNAFQMSQSPLYEEENWYESYKVINSRKSTRNKGRKELIIRLCIGGVII